MLTEYEKNGFVVIDNFLPLEVYSEMVKIFNNGEFVEINQIREERYKLWETADDKHFPSIDEDYLAHFWSSFDVADNPKVIGMYDKYIKPLFEKISNERNLKVRHQATKYKKISDEIKQVEAGLYFLKIGEIENEIKVENEINADAEKEFSLFNEKI